jgi:hypothetical protein
VHRRRRHRTNRPLRRPLSCSRPPGSRQRSRQHSRSPSFHSQAAVRLITAQMARRPKSNAPEITIPTQTLRLSKSRPQRPRPNCCAVRTALHETALHWADACSLADALTCARSYAIDRLISLRTFNSESSGIAVEIARQTAGQSGVSQIARQSNRSAGSEHARRRRDCDRRTACAARRRSNRSAGAVLPVGGGRGVC